MAGFDLLESMGLKYDQLSDEETSYYIKWLQQKESTEITVDAIHGYIRNMRMAVDEQLAKHDLSHKEDMYLKARLKNYILLEAFIDSAAMARKQLEEMGRGKI